MTKDNIKSLKGFRDFLPQAAATRQKVLEQIRAVFETYGFLPLETPALEYKEILIGKYGAEADKLLYSFKDQGKREVAMRYDLTVPLARVVAEYQNELPMPFKRYQIAPVWRADRPQKGRFREFTQCDVDVVGSDSIFADAEIIACINQCLRELGLSDIIVKVNNRKVLDGLIKEADVPADKTVQAIRIIDKLEKIGEDGVRGELTSIGIQTKQANSLLELLGVSLEGPDDVEKKLEGVAGTGELAELLEILLDTGVKNFEVDLTLARGLDYYTGTIFEFVLPGASQFGSVAGGGRYDNLIGIFLGKNIPAVGCSIGIDRLLAALEELELVKYDVVSDVLVCNLEENLTAKYLEIVQKLRDAGIKTDFYYETAKLDKQLKYADKKNINFAVLIGPDEAETGDAAVKNLATGKQERIKQKDLIRFLKQSR